MPGRTTLPSGRRLIIIKDLSQYNGKPEQDEIVKGLFASAYGTDRDGLPHRGQRRSILPRTLRRYADAT